MGDSWKRCVKWNKANTKGQIPYDSIHLQCLVQLLSCVWFLLFSYKELCLSLWDPMDHSMPGFFLHHYLPEFAQTHVHWVSDTFQPSHPLSSPFLPAFNFSQHQGIFQWVSSYTSGSQSIGASASVLPVNSQGWSPLGLAGLISLLSKGLSGFFFSTAVWRHQFLGVLPSLQSSSHNHTWPLERPQPWLYGPLSAKWCFWFLTHCLGLS